MPSSEESEARYDIEFADEAVYAYACIPSDEVYNRMGKLIDTLAVFPYFGQAYHPCYRAAEPPVACRVLFCGRYGIYYHVDDERRVVTVLAIEDERRDPMNRFCSRNE